MKRGKRKQYERIVNKGKRREGMERKEVETKGKEKSRGEEGKKGK